MNAVTSTAVNATRDRRALVRLALVMLALTVVLRLPAFFVDVFNSDETFLATQAQVVLDGGDLYREAADRKPPLVPYIYAATFAVFGTDELWSARVAAMGAVVLTALLLAMEARRRYGRNAAWIAGLLCVFGSVAFAPQDGQAANFEIFMLPAMTAAVLLARRGRSAGSGVGVALATLAKQTGVLTLAPVLYQVGRTQGRRGMMRALIGFAVPIGVAAAVVGPRRLINWTVLGNGSYVSSDTVSALVLGMFLVMSLAWAACNAPALWRLPVAWRARREPDLDGGNDLDLWLWLVSGAVSVMVGLRFFGHYYLQLLPPVCLLAASALTKSSRRIRIGSLVVAGIMAVGFSIAGYFIQPFGGEPEYQRVSRYLAHHVKGEDRILVWGSVPEIYWSSGALPATRFLTTLTFLAGNHPGRPPEDSAPEDSGTRVWDLFLQDLHAHPPRYIVDTAPANIRGAQWTPIDRFPPLEAIVRTQYHYVTSIDGIALYRRN